MRILLALAIASALGVSAQTQAPVPAPGPAAPAAKPGLQVTPGGAPNTFSVNIPVVNSIPVAKLPPETVVATIDGQKVTAGQLQIILLNLPPQLQQKIEADRKEFVRQYGALMRLVSEARKLKLDEQSPYKESIEYQTWIVLQRATIEHRTGEFTVAPEAVKKFYADNQERYNQVKFKAIYLPFNASSISQADQSGKELPNEAEAQAKAEALVRQARAGADFVKLVKENSGDKTSLAKDGDFPPIRKSDAQVPPEIKNALFAAKPGEVTDPLRQPRGFYVFRIQESGPQPLEEVQKSITDELKSTQLRTWMDELKNSVDVKMEGEAPAPAPAAPAPSGSAAPPQK